jgi:hypothetical protein
VDHRAPSADANPTAAQDVTEPVLKATFIYTFAKFTEWPAEAISAA